MTATLADGQLWLLAEPTFRPKVGALTTPDIDSALDRFYERIILAEDLPLDDLLAVAGPSSWRITTSRKPKSVTCSISTRVTRPNHWLALSPKRCSARTAHPELLRLGPRQLALQRLDDRGGSGVGTE